MDPSHPPILLAQCKAFHKIDDILKEIASLLKVESVNDFKIHISLPYSYIASVKEKFTDENIHLGAEIVLGSDEGNFTKSISGRMLQDTNAEFVLIGASQDRTFPNNSHSLGNKLKVALEHKITPFICIEESLQEHQDKASKKILCDQLKERIEEVSPEDLKTIFIVYNAEWISRTPWEAKSQDLSDAYQTFKDAVSEILGPTFPAQQLIVSVPGYSRDVSKLIESLKSSEPPIYGYSLGILGDSAEYLQPLADVAIIGDENLQITENTKEENKENENV